MAGLVAACYGALKIAGHGFEPHPPTTLRDDSTWANRFGLSVEVVGGAP